MKADVVRRLRSKTPLRAILITSFVVQISAAVGLTAWLSLRNGQQAVDEIANNLWTEITARTVQRIDEYTQIPQNVIADTLAYQDLNLADFRDPDILTRYLWHQMQQYDGLFITAVGYETGEVIGVGVEKDGNLVIRAIDPGQTQLHTYAVSGQGDRAELMNASDFDLKARPWYREAMEAGELIWTGIYPNYARPFNLLSAASPIYDRETGRAIGVTNVTLSLWQISDFLQGLEIGRSGQIFIIERSGDLVASSTGEPLYKVERVGGAEIRERLPAIESRNARVRQTAEYLIEQFGDFDRIEQAEHLEFFVNGQRTMVRVTPFSDELGLDWLIAIVVPESDVMAQIQTNTRTTLWLCLGAFVLATGSSILTARWITRPLLKLNQAAKAISKGSFESAQFPDAIAASGTREVTELSHSFHQMTQQLQASFAALKTSEAEFRNLAANVPGAIFRYILRPDGTDAVLYMSPGCYRLWEVEAQAVEENASVLWELVEPEDLSAMQASVMESAQTLETWCHEWRIRRHSGQLKWLQGIGQPARQPNGDVIWGSVILDVSDRKQAELALKIQRDFNELIAKITSRFVDIGPDDLDAEINRALQDIAEVTGVDTSYVFELDEAAQTLSMTHEWCDPAYPPQIEHTQNIPFAAFPWSIARLNERDLVYATQLSDLPEAAAVDRASWQQFNIAAVLMIPLVQQSTVTGYMGFASFSQPMQWDDEIVRLLQVMGQTIAKAQESVQVQTALIESEARWQFALEGSGDGVWDWNVRTNEVFFSRQWKTMLGYEEHEIGNSLEECESRIHPEDKAQYDADLEQHFAGRVSVYQNEHRVRCKDNSYRWVLDRGKVIEWTDEGKPLRVIGTCTDITDRKQAETRLQDLSNRLGLATRAAHMGIWDLDLVRNRLIWDDRMYALYGISPEDFHEVYEAWEAAVHPDDLIPARTALQQALYGEKNYHCEFRVRWPDGTIRYLEAYAIIQRDAEGQPLRAIGVNVDISDRKQAEDQLIYSALHDALTDLPNRTLLTSRLEAAIHNAQQSSSYHFAVLFLDLDRFKVINDSLGHLVGDELLLATAQKLQSIIRPTDLAARLGGDEFVVLLECVPNVQAVIRTAERLLSEFNRATEIDSRNIFVTTSIGIVWGVNTYTDASDLLRDADIALYRAKAKGRNRYEIFDTEMHVQAMKRMTLEHDLRVAINRQEFIIYYQPIVDLHSRRLTGFEALIRWQHPVRGFVSPADFIPIAEETGAIVPMSQWILQAACEQVATWRRQFRDLDDLRISINLSGQDLQQPILVETIRQTLDRVKLPATSLTLEITESLLIENIETTIQLLGQLRSLGIRISIDDFGTGYSSLSYLYSLPADYLKIDRSFVGKMQPEDKNYQIVQAVVSLSDRLQLAAIAEGIETLQQLEWLKDLGCEFGQGYYLSRPLAPEAAGSILANGRSI